MSVRQLFESRSCYSELLDLDHENVKVEEKSRGY